MDLQYTVNEQKLQSLKQDAQFIMSMEDLRSKTDAQNFQFQNKTKNF